MSFTGISAGKVGQNKVNSLGSVDLNNSGGHWGKEAVPSCLVPGPKLTWCRRTNWLGV